MTDQPADRGGEGEALAAKPPAVFLVLLSLAILGVTSVDVFSVVDERARAGQPVPLWEPMVWELSSGVALIALLPGLLALAGRVPPWPMTIRRFGPHLAALLVFSLLHVLGMGLLRATAYRLVGGAYDPLTPLGNWGYELRKDALTYAAVMTLYAVWRRLGARETGASESLSPAPLEVRDGPRRHLIDPRRIDWVEAAGNYVELHGPDGAVLHRASLAQTLARLSPAGFVRIHRSRLVRLAAVRLVESTASGDFVVVLADGTRLGGSRRHRVESLSPALDPAARSD